EETLTDRMFVNDANSESAPGYAIFNARIVSSALSHGSGAEVTVGAQNVFNTRYISSVSVNAAGGKFYEPGSQRSLYVGISLVGATRPPFTVVALTGPLAFRTVTPPFTVFALTSAPTSRTETAPLTECAPTLTPRGTRTVNLTFE